MLKNHVCKKRSENLRRILELLYGVFFLGWGYELFIQEQGNEKKKPGVGNFILLTGEMTLRCTPSETLY